MFIMGGSYTSTRLYRIDVANILDESARHRYSTTESD